MRKFNITVNGVSYEVEVEEITEGAQPVPRPVVTTQSNEMKQNIAPASNKSSDKKVSKEVPTGATVIEAPMPGNAWKVLVNEGDEVKEGQVLIILEAMKMENEIMSPVNGVVASVNVVEGASVSSGDVLVSIK